MPGRDEEGGEAEGSNVDQTAVHQLGLERVSGRLWGKWFFAFGDLRLVLLGVVRRRERRRMIPAYSCHSMTEKKEKERKGSNANAREKMT